MGARIPIVKSDAARQEDTIEDTFKTFSKDGHMSQAQFAKLCRDAGLVKHGATAEIAFNRAKQIGASRIDFREFRLALAEVAKKKKMNVELAEQKVAETKGPILIAPVPYKVKFHDEREPQNARGEGEHDFAIYWQRDGRAKDWHSPMPHTYK
jgi:hypothetical protein